MINPPPDVLMKAAKAKYSPEELLYRLIHWNLNPDGSRRWLDEDLEKLKDDNIFFNCLSYYYEIVMKQMREDCQKDFNMFKKKYFPELSS
jgi:hypothetical protein